MADEAVSWSSFRLFSSSNPKHRRKSQAIQPPPSPRDADAVSAKPNPPSIDLIVRGCADNDEGRKGSDHDSDADGLDTFADLGLAKWSVDTCRELCMRRPTPVQRRCIPRILAGDDVLGIAQTGSGKTAAFALPILHRLAEDPFGVFALVITSTRELACQLAEQFRALGSPLNLRCTLVVGGMSMQSQARAISQRPHVIVATPGRIKVLLDEVPDMPAAFSRIKFLVLDEADRVLDVSFADELKVIFRWLPKIRQTLLFSATMTDNLRALLEMSSNRSYFYEAYEGFKMVESLKQQYIFIPRTAKDLYLFHILSNMKKKDVRSAIVFVSRRRSCHLLSLLLEELDLPAVALHSDITQSLRFSALNRFKSAKVPILISTDLASRGLDIPTVDLVINYDIPRYARNYVHRVGRTARAGRDGISISFVTENDVDLIHEIEAVIEKQLDAFDCDEKAVLEDITRVYKARRVAKMKMIDDGFEEKAQARKEQKLKSNEKEASTHKRKR